MDRIDRFRGALLGLAVGDAVGTTVEFRRRGTFLPVTDMTGGGPFRLEAGQWTDDTSMALCLAVSLIESGGFDARDQIERYCRWMDEGYLSSNGRCFDVGNTVRAALTRYKAIGQPFAGSADPNSAGNGSLMRLAPVAMFFHPDHQAAVHHAGESSRTTHGAAECIDACRLFAAMLCRAFDGAGRAHVLFGGGEPAELTASAKATASLAEASERRRKLGPAYESEKIVAIALGEYCNKPPSGIRGSGYVVDSLEAALWCFHTTNTFEAAILTAANLGDDADTTAAVSGQIAGAVYGASAIPHHWLAKLAMRQFIEELADNLCR
jgi:ADP-ribosyl-[dinitrogen reductase] hydrolase